MREWKKQAKEKDPGAYHGFRRLQVEYFYFVRFLQQGKKSCWMELRKRKDSNVEEWKDSDLSRIGGPCRLSHFRH